MLEILDYSLERNHHIIFPAHSLRIPENARVGIIGPNGSGKSSWLQGILGLLPLKSGRFLFKNKDLSHLGSISGYMPQNGIPDPFFPVTALEVVMMGRYGFNESFHESSEKALTYLDHAGLAHLANQPFHRFSGGQRQRILLARAMAREKNLLFLDEPFAGVDMPSIEAMWPLLESFAQNGIVFVVHHDLGTAPQLFTHLLMLRPGNAPLFGSLDTIFTKTNLQEIFGSGWWSLNLPA